MRDKNCWISCGIHLWEHLLVFAINYQILPQTIQSRYYYTFLFADGETAILIKWIIWWSVHRWIWPLNPTGKTDDLLITKELLNWKLCVVSWVASTHHSRAGNFCRWKIGSSQQRKCFRRAALARFLPHFPTALSLFMFLLILDFSPPSYF